MSSDEFDRDSLIRAMGQITQAIASQVEVINRLAEGLAQLAASNEQLANTLLADLEEVEGEPSMFMDGSKARQ